MWAKMFSLVVLWLLSCALLASSCSTTCNSLYTPNVCASFTSSILITALTTNGKYDQDTFDCGSKSTDLADVIVQFTVGVSGMYTIDTENIGSGDTTLQVEQCDATVLACNDDRSASDASSLVVVRLTSGTPYIVAVSKAQDSDSEVTFDLRISLNSPTSAPTPPTFAVTVQPTLKPTTLAPTSLAPTTLAPATNEPTIQSTTIAPTTNGTASSNNASTIAGIGGGIGAMAALALGFMGKRSYDKRKRASTPREDLWTAEDQSRLLAAFHNTHDLNAIYPMFPNHSRETVAFRTRQIIQSQSGFFLNSPRFVKSTYLFVAERKREITARFASPSGNHGSWIGHFAPSHPRASNVSKFSSRKHNGFASVYEVPHDDPPEHRWASNPTYSFKEY